MGMLLYKNLKLGFLFLYFFSQPFLYWDPLGVRSSFTVPAFAFLFYLVIMLLKPLDNLNSKYFILPGGALFLLWLLLESHIIYGAGIFYSDSSFDISFLQIIIMMWLVQCHLYRDESAFLVIWQALIASCILTAFLASLGIGLMAARGDEYYGGRLYFFGMNPNQLGNIAALCLVLSSLFVLEMSIKISKLWKVLLTIGVGCCLYILAFTASRGSIVAFLVPFLFALTLSGIKFYKKVIIIVIATLALLILIFFVLDFSLLMERFTDSSNLSSLGNRTERWGAAFDIFSNSPFFGVGENGYKVLTVNNYGFSGSPHNSFLQIMAYGGVVGLLLFLIPVLYVGKISLSTYIKDKKTSPMVLILFFILIMSKDGGALNSTFNWAVIALSMGVALNNLNKKKEFNNA